MMAMAGDELITAWLLKPGNHSEIENVFISSNIIGIEARIGDNFRYFESKMELKLYLEKRLPIMKKKPREISEIFDFTAIMKENDYVLMPASSDPNKIHIGKIKGDYVFNPIAQFSFSRPVAWYCEIGRDRLSRKLKNSFNTNYTVTDIQTTELFEDEKGNQKLLDFQ